MLKYYFPILLTIAAMLPFFTEAADMAPLKLEKRYEDPDLPHDCLELRDIAERRFKEGSFTFFSNHIQTTIDDPAKSTSDTTRLEYLAPVGSHAVFSHAKAVGWEFYIALCELSNEAGISLLPRRGMGRI